MIIDKVENARLYRGIGQSIDCALQYIQDADLSSITKVILDGGNVSIQCMDYLSKPVEACNKENHRLNADIHICLKGVEIFGYCNLHDATPVSEYDPKTDKQFFDAPMNYFKLLPGMFALVFPDDVHSAMTADGVSAAARKLLVKCKL